MPIVSSSGLASTTTVQDILNCTSQDVRAVLQTTGADQAILLDYINRITNELLRFSRWTFLEGGPQVFLTVPGITDYWIGTGVAPSGCVNTNLGLNNVFTIKQGEFIDRSNNIRLGKTSSPPVGQIFSLPGKPKLWRNDQFTPYVINIYPPTNQNTKQFVPAASITTLAAGGTLPIRTYYLTMTFGDNVGGESTASIEQVITIPANFLLTVASPVLPITTDATTLQTSTGPLIGTWNIYAATTRGAERLQSSGINLGTDWTEPSTGLTTSGVTAPGTNTLAVLGGYVMEFNYYQSRLVLTDVTQVIQVPDTYKDVVCAGVNWLAFKYLEMDDNAKLWQQVFEAGKVQMIKDKQLFPRGEEFIRPDPASVTQSSTGGLGLDSGLESSLP
jgi:hypothetical protein